MENKIILTTKGNISGADKQSLRSAGVVIAEVKDINAIKIIAGTDYFDIDDIALSAIEAIKNYSHSDAMPVKDFAQRLLTRVLKVKSPTITPNSKEDKVK